jgi:hypothetical protein
LDLLVFSGLSVLWSSAGALASTAGLGRVQDDVVARKRRNLNLHRFRTKDAEITESVTGTLEPVLLCVLRTPVRTRLLPALAEKFLASLGLCPDFHRKPGNQVSHGGRGAHGGRDVCARLMSTDFQRFTVMLALHGSGCWLGLGFFSQ